MKLSDAMVLGDSLRDRQWSIWLSANKSCGCAIGGAILAIGKGDEFLASYLSLILSNEPIFRYWPWLEYEGLNQISARFRKVCRGEMTFEQLVDYVRSIEPDETEETVAVESTVDSTVESILRS